MNLRAGYELRVIRSLKVGGYHFSQTFGRDGFVLFISRENQIFSWYGNFDPKDPALGIWGSPYPESPITTGEWKAHSAKAVAAIAPLGGLGEFDKLPYEDRYVRQSDGKRVTEEEATLTPTDPAWERILAEAFDKAGLHETDSQPVETDAYSNADLIDLFRDTPGELLRLLRSVEKVKDSVASARNVLTQLVEAGEEEGV